MLNGLHQNQKTFAVSKVVLGKLKDKPQMERKHWQITCPTYIKNSQNSIKNNKTPKFRKYNLPKQIYGW